MLLAVDVGNTTTVLGAFDGARLVDHWRLQTVPARTADEYGVIVRSLFAQANLEPSRIEAVAACSVVPAMQPTLIELARRTFGREVLFVGPGVRTGMPVLYESPREVGPDRICNAVAAYERYKQALVVVDFGTATIFDAVSQKGEYLGGAICPGIGQAMEALFQTATKLPRVEFKRPPRAIGKDNVGAVQAGLVYGYVALVDGMCARFAAELGGSPPVVATGAQAALLAQESKAIAAVDEFLTLEGLRLVFERNADRH